MILNEKELERQESLLKTTFNYEREIEKKIYELLKDLDSDEQFITLFQTYQNLQLQIGEIIFEIAKLNNSNEANAYEKLLIKSDRSQPTYHKLFKLIIQIVSLKKQKTTTKVAFLFKVNFFDRIT